MNFDENLIVHIGLHKTGTSWLQSVLFTPGNGFCLLHESTAPWNDALIKGLVQGVDFDPHTVARLAEGHWDQKNVPVISAERLSGHPASGGFDRWEIADRLLRAFPKAKIVIGTREWSSWRRSIYQQLVSEGFTGKSIQDALPETTWKQPGPHSSYFDINALVTGYKHRFGAERVFLWSYEQWVEEPALFLQCIADVCENPLAINALPDVKKRVNASVSMRKTKAQRWSNYFMPSPLNPSPAILLPTFVAKGIGWILSVFD